VIFVSEKAVTRTSNNAYSLNPVNKINVTSENRNSYYTTSIDNEMNERKHYAMPVFDETTGKMLEYRHLINHPDPKVRKQWQISSVNEFGRTMQGVGKNRPEEDRIKGTDTMHLIKKYNVPKGKKITYAQLVSEIRLQRAEIHRTRLTAGGDRLGYEGKKVLIEPV
jgi:hypothetical protein